MVLKYRSEACHSGRVIQGELSLLVSDQKFHKALPTEDMEALEKFGVSVGIKTDSTVQLFFEFFCVTSAIFLQAAHTLDT